jgi:hypothetical protein
MELPRTTERVPRHTAEEANQKIAAETARSVSHYSRSPELIAERLDALEREWDIERTLEANAAAVSLVGLALGATVDRRFFALPAIVAGFLLQHALQGWCPPLPAFRRMGFRTQSEIDEERYALKALRGDFTNVRSGDHTTQSALDAARS